MDHIQPFLDYFAQNPGWAIVVVFLIAFGEALLIIGLFVPSTAVLVGAGVLVGSGHLPFWPVFLATLIGAVGGDQISYWAGRFFGERLKNLWPLNRFPQLVLRGEEFVRNHGGKSIALGRFVPGVKAVVPGIVGMLGMSQIYFASVNISSGIVWTAAHVIPGILIGQGLAFAGELSGHLGLVLIELLVILAVAGWIIRLFAASMSPYLDHMLQRISAWAKTRNSRSLHRFGRAVSPENPRSLLIIFFIAVLLLGLIAFLLLLSGMVARNAIPNTDISVFNLMREIRNAPADELMVPLTMLGDGFVLTAMMATIVGWLVWRKAWRAAIASTAVFLAGKLFAVLLKYGIHRPRPLELYTGAESFSFPSGHATMAAITFGVLAVLASHAMNRWSRSLVYAVCGLIVITIAYSRIYLGVHWLSDVLGGVVFGAIMVAAFGVAIEAIPPRRIMPLGLLGATFIAFVAAGALNVSNNFYKAEKFYAAPERSYSMVPAEWESTAWLELPARRIDLAGKPEEQFIIQWAGSLEVLQKILESRGWVYSPKWTWRDSLSYLDPNAVLGSVAPRPALHLGLKAKLTMTLALNGESNRRLVMRAYKTNANLKSANAGTPIFLVSLTQESLRKSLQAYVVPTLVAAKAEQVAEFVMDMALPSNTRAVTEQRPGDGGQVRLITLP
jgi:membrane protein DedA with SNARE-associated domain/membrane-associated phospholipid phosphatase